MPTRTPQVSTFGHIHIDSKEKVRVLVIFCFGNTPSARHLLPNKEFARSRARPCGEVASSVLKSGDDNEGGGQETSPAQSLLE